MFEGVVAHLLNKYLGKYIKDLDSENLNVGIFNGTVQLTDLKLKAEALYELELPIEVKAGCIGKVSVDIPWLSLSSEPVLVHIEDMLILAGPVGNDPYDADKERLLARARKTRRLELLEEPFAENELDKPRGFFENLIGTIVNNVQVSVQNVHIRYEDTITSPQYPFACGMVLQSLTAITTSSKWKPIQLDSASKTIYKLVKLESFSVYWSYSCSASGLVRHQLPSSNWKNLMKRALQTFSIGSDEFDFVLKPISAKVKIIFNKSLESKIPKLLVDVLLQDVALQLSRQQYLEVILLGQSFTLMEINQRYRKYRPNVPRKGNAKAWWKYAFDAVVGEYIRPYSWKAIKEHRQNYRQYKELYKERLQKPNDAEVRVDVQMMEDKLNIANVIMAREEAKLELLRSEPNRAVPRKKDQGWWASWFGGDEEPEEEIEVVGERERSFWSRLTPEEKEKLYEAIEYADASTEVPEHYIAHKVNFTLANCTLSLVGSTSGHEVLVATLTQFLTSLETRPGARAFKVSARTEGFVVEGTSSDHDLVTVLSVDKSASEISPQHVFALDFEQNPLDINANYGLMLYAEPVEVVYNEHSVSELMTFFSIPTVSAADIRSIAAEQFNSLATWSKTGLLHALTHRKTFFFNIEFKSPYFVVHEHGSFQKSGNILVIDMGKLSFKSDLQSDSLLLEEATKMEIEEKLYDRFNVCLSDIQVLFTDSGDEWRMARLLPESDMHLVPKIKLQALFSNSVKPDYRFLPRHKLNVSVSSLKLNLSDRRLGLLVEFAHNFPLPHLLAPGDAVDGPSKEHLECLVCGSVKADESTKVEPSTEELKLIRQHVTEAPSAALGKPSRSSTQLSIAGSEQYLSASDHSDEEFEDWGWTLDVPGFDDNVSASNTVNSLLRFVIGEVALHLARSSDQVDKPYLMLRLDKLCADVALMEYGPAVQASINGIYLVDKLHIGPTGEYLELLSSKAAEDMVSVLYRKVKASCPEFKSDFHQVEHSAVIDFTSVSITFHREALLTLGRYLLYVYQKLNMKEMSYSSLIPEAAVKQATGLFLDDQDPPVPPGSTKLNVALRVHEIKARLCDVDLELADVCVSGLECDYVQKANEKLIVRVDLTHLSVTDLMESTLYSKVLSIEDDKLFDFKYVRKAPRTKSLEMEEEKLKGPDGTVRFHVGRMQLVLLRRFFVDVQKFLEPFLQPEARSVMFKSAEKVVQQQVADFAQKSVMLQLSVDIHAPTILIPQKSDSPNLIVLSLGDLNIENFFKEVSSRPKPDYVDNILVRFSSLHMTRAIVLLDGSTQPQESILEPMRLSLDIKRALTLFNRNIMEYEVRGTMDLVKVNIGQKDLSTIFAIFKENFEEKEVIESHHQVSTPMSPPVVASPALVDDPVKKLQTFLTTSVDVYKKTNVFFTMEGLHIVLYADAEDAPLSSPVRDPLHALSKLELEEVTTNLDLFSDQSLEFKCSLQSLLLEDTRSDSTLVHTRVFCSSSGDPETVSAGINVSSPNMVDITYRETSSGDATVDVLIEETSLKVSVPYLLALLNFVYEALPPAPTDQQRELQRAVEGAAAAATGGAGGSAGASQQSAARRRLPSDNTSGYHSVVSGAAQDDAHSVSFSLVLKKPEIVFFADPREHESEVIVLKMDIMMDYCRNLGQQTMTASVINLNASSFFWGRRKDTLYTIIRPFNIEVNQSYNASTEEQKLQAKTSDISVHLSSQILSTASSVVTELLSSLKEVTAPEDPLSRQDSADLLELWSPKAVSPPRLQEEADERPGCRKSPAYQSNAPAESLDISVPRVSVVFEIDAVRKQVPALFLQASLETGVHDWSRKMYMTADVKLEALYYSEERSTWEPLIEPVLQAENCYRPWELLIKVFRDRSYPILSAQDNRSSNLLLDAVDGLEGTSTGSCGSVSTSDDASEEETEMTVIRRHPPARPKRALSHKSRESSTLVAMDSDSENDENVLQRIAHAFGHLFSDHSSEEEQSDGEATAGVKSESEETEMADNELSTTDDRPVFLEKGDAPDSAADNSSRAALATYILVDSRDSLNLNITPTATNIFWKLWNDIQKKEGRPRQLGSPSEALAIDNLLGPEALVSVLIKDESERFVVAQQAWGQAPAFSPTASKTPVAIAGGDFSRRQRSVELQGEDVEAASTPLSSVAVFEEKPLCELYKERTTEKISLEVPGFEKFQCWMPRKAGSSLFALHPMKNKMRYFFILEVKIENGTKTITARSPLRLENHLGRPVQLLCEKSSLEAVGVSAERYAQNPFHETHIRLATLAPGGAAYSVPLFVAYHSRIFLQPTSLTSDCAGYEPSTDGLWSQDIVLCNKSATFLSCKSKDPQQEQLFWMKVVCKETRDARVVAQGTVLVPNCTLHIVAPIVVHNSLPYPIELRLKSLPQEIKLDEGDSAPIFSVPPNSAEEVAIEVPYYLGSAWKGRAELSASADEARVISMQPQPALPERMHRQLSIAAHLATDKSLELFLYAPYWVINKTGLPLQIRGSSSDVIYDCSASSEELLLFRFKKRKHKKAKIRVYNSSWSSSFCLDTVGNDGVVVCKDKERNKKYRFFLRIQMSRLNLSKIISITPFFLVVNNTKHYFRFMEENEAADLWFDIGPQQCLPFWPDTDKMKMYLRHKDSTVTSQHFYFGENQNTALRMDNGSAVCVEVSGGVDGPKTISLFPYSTGDAPVRVENLCEDLFLKIHQKCLGQVTLLSPYQSVLYTWDDPTIERTLMWNLYNRKKPGFIARIHRDGFGKEKVSFRSLRPPVTETKKTFKKSSVDQSSTDDDSESENGVLPKKTRRDIVVVYWISFLDQNQRVLLFTQDERIWKHARKAVDGEKSRLECFVSLHGLGVSLVNGALVELAYLSLSSAPAQWEVKVNDAWKPLTLELAAWLEYRWSCRTKSAELKDYVQVDFEKMQMTKPFLGSLQRTYHPALWLQYRQSDQQTLVLAKIRRIQLDNQLPDALFPTVLYRFTPQSKWPSCPAKPMLEAALLLHHYPKLNLNTIKYLKLLLQEVHVKLDKGFLLSVFDVFSGMLAEPDEKTRLRSDMKLIYAPLYPFKSDLDTSRSQRTVFEFVHFSPVKIHLSFSPRGTVHKAVPDQASLSQDILDVFFNSVGATLSEVKDVELRMAFFEQKGRLVSMAGLLSEVRSHYVSQVVQQSYVLILGLDVLGNPYGLVKDFTRGFGDFFYEPIVGSIQGPEEFAEGLSRGAQSLMGHVVGSSAGSVALITGSLGQALAVLSFDEDYQRKRRLRMEQHSSSLPESLVTATKGFVMGILLGVSGVVMNPVTGAQLEGLEGFFKGIGKGLLGLITKPTGGVVDMFSIAFDGIRRAAEMGKGVVVRQRLPRFINPNLGLQPFSQYQATGYRLLLQLSKGHYSLTDTYWAHAPLGRDDRANIAMVTDRHVFLLEKCRFWGGWGIQWSIRLEDVVSVPSISGNSLVIRVRQDESIASFTGNERFLVCEDEEILQWLKLKIEKVLLVTMEERPCSLDS